ncbi:hypothetical protein [Saccharophagus degradans]|uniref:hypothetical protein n=1 Tax=Saccharophagus degradans TaxID=86304 RepID=UPI003EBEA9E1
MSALVNRFIFSSNKYKRLGQTIIYAFLPQHFLYFRPLPQTHGSLRPILGAPLITGDRVGGQQRVLLQVGSSGTKGVFDKFLQLSDILVNTIL